MNTEVLEKLKKILTLANDKGALPGEIEAAMVRARSLAVKHNIELSQVDLTPDTKGASAIEVEKDNTLRTKSAYWRAYHDPICTVLKQVFGVEIFFNFTRRGSRKEVNSITLIGEPFDIAVAVAVFPYLERVFPQAYFKMIADERLSESAADKNGFFWGMAQGIIRLNKVEEAKQVPDGASYALVLRSKEDAIAAKAKELFSNAKINNSKKEVSLEGLVYGRREGAKINLKQLPGSDKNSLTN